MPYRSEKQRRFMHAKHPEIAARWDKTYGGTVRKSDGYGSNQVGRRILDDELDEFGKGVLHQGVVRPIARRGGTARRMVTGDAQNARRIIGKGHDWTTRDLPAPTVNLQRRTAGYSVRPGTTRQQLAGGARTNLQSRLKAVKAVAKADLEDVEKVSFGGAMRGAKNFGGVIRGNFKAGLNQSRGMTGRAAKPQMSMGSSVMAGRSKMTQRMGSFAQTAGRNPLATGAVAGAGVGGVGASAFGNRRQSMYAPPTPMYGGYAKRAYDPEDERRFRQGAYAAGTGIAGVGLTASGVRGIRRDTADAQGDAARVRETAGRIHTRKVPDEHKVRTHVYVDDPSGRKFKSGPRKGKPVRVRQPASPADLIRDAEEGKKVNERRAFAQHQNDAIGSLRNHKGGVKGRVVSGRNAGKVGGGIALLGTSGALLRSRHEERWN